MVSNKILQTKLSEVQQLLLSIQSLAHLDHCVTKLIYASGEVDSCNFVDVSVEFYTEALAVGFRNFLVQFNVAVPQIVRRKVWFRLYED